jgi:hypothetical protein
MRTLDITSGSPNSNTKDMKRILDFDGFVNESDQEYRKLSKKSLLDNFNAVPNNSPIYDAKESDFEDLPWYRSIKKAFPDFKLDRVRKKRGDEGGYSWYFSVPVSTGRGRHDRIYEVYRPSSRYSFSNDLASISVYNENLTYPSEFRVYLNDKESWNQVFKMIYFSLFAGITGNQVSRSLDHIMNLFSSDLQDLYKDGSLGIVGVRKNCNPYGGHYKSSVDLIKNLPYGIPDKIKEEFIRKIEKEPGVIQYAISQCQLPDDSAEKIKGWNTRTYPKGEVLDYYNFIKSEGYNPPKGFEEETEEFTNLQGGLADIGL